MKRATVQNATWADTMYDRLLRAERERDVLAARVAYLEAVLLEQPGVCEECRGLLAGDDIPPADPAIIDRRG